MHVYHFAEDELVGRSWGARTLYYDNENASAHTPYTFEFLPDRHVWTGRSSDAAGDSLFRNWLLETAFPWLREAVDRVRLRRNENRELSHIDWSRPGEGAGYELRANPNSSHGYLYIGAAEIVSK